MNRDMLSRRPQCKRFEISIADDGKEGVDKAISGKPDLSLPVMTLPVRDGQDAAAIF